MNTHTKREHLVERKVTYTLFKDGQFYIIESVPARVNTDSGEQFFSPQTVEHLQHLILDRPRPARIVQTPVYEFR